MTKFDFQNQFSKPKNYQNLSHFFSFNTNFGQYLLFSTFFDNITFQIPLIDTQFLTALEYINSQNSIISWVMLIFRQKYS